jgi:hypothetical protein
MITDTSKRKREIKELTIENEIVMELIHKHINDNATNLGSQNIFKEKYDRLTNGLDSIKKSLLIIKDERNKKNMKQIKITQFI